MFDRGGKCRRNVGITPRSWLGMVAHSFEPRPGGQGLVVLCEFKASQVCKTNKQKLQGLLSCGSCLSQ